MNTKAKLVIAVICLVAAAVVVAMNMGLFGGSARPGTTATSTTSTTDAASGETKEDVPETGGILKKDRR